MAESEVISRGITRAVLIGADDGTLPGLGRDIAELSAAVEAIMGADNLWVLRGREVTRARVLETISIAGTPTGPDSSDELLLLYLGGHGMVDSRGELVLSTAAAGSDRLGLRDVQRFLSSSLRVLVVLDTSFAGISAEMSGWSESTVVMCSTEADAQALDDSGFTRLIARGLATGEADLDGDGFVDAGELYRYVADSMAAADARQRPLLRASLDPGGVVVARNPNRPLRRGGGDRADRLPQLIEPFVDREAETTALVSLLTSDRPREIRSVRAAALVGAAGMGKTQTAVRAVQRCRVRFVHGVLYASARDGPDAVIMAFARALGYRAGSDRRPDLFVMEATRRLAVLFVIDDVDADVAAHLLSLLRPGEDCALLLIGRESLPGVESIQLGPLPENAVREFLETLAAAGGRSPDDEFVASLGGQSPLYIRIAASLEAGAGREPDAVPESVEDALRRSYEQLPQVAAMLFRRGVLVDDEPLDVELAAVLVDGAGRKDVLDSLTATSLLAVQADQRAVYASDQVRQFARTVLGETEDEGEIAGLRQRVQRWLLVNRRFPPEPRIASDYWTTQDELNHAPYADAIAAFIRHRSTLPPLTIGIKGPWGAGKTSLMRMVQQRLDPPIGAKGSGVEIRLSKSTRHRLKRRLLVRRTEPDAHTEVTNAEVLERAKVAGTRSTTEAPLRANPEKGIPLAEGTWRPTVWFNPWIYQSGEQVWAGLAHEVIRQVTDRLPAGDRERFWLELNLSRLDRDAVRRRAYRALWERVLPLVVVFALAVVTSLFIVALGRITEGAWLTRLGTVVAGGSGIALGGALWTALRFLGRTAAGPLGTLVKGPDLVGAAHAGLAKEFSGSFDSVMPDPGYASKLGFLHLVQTDIKRVLDLVAREDQPLVIFVDDLDRCSPGTVAQVIEAINLFLAGEFRNCIFVLALEPALVAAHIEVTYKDLVAALKEGRSPGEWSTLGWRFLEKIVQLPLSLPPVSTGLERYVASLLNVMDGDAAAGTAPGVARQPRPTPPTASDDQAPDGGRSSTPTTMDQAPVDDTSVHGGQTVSADSDPDLVERITAGIRARRPGIASLPDVARDVQTEILPQAGPDPLLPETVQAVERVFADLYSDADALASIEAALPALNSSNPREIKRYINLFRFYTFIVQRQRLEGLAAPPGDCIAKLAALAIRWPHLLSSLSQPASADGASQPLVAVLEAAARTPSDPSSDAPSGGGQLQVDPWPDALRAAGLIRAGEGDAVAVPDWSAHLHAFLAGGPRVGELASRLL